jgi:cytochrome P450
MAVYILLGQETRDQVAAVKASLDSGQERTSRKIIFNQLLDPDAGEGHVVPSVDDIKDEAVSLVSAASDTAGHAMTMATYYVLSNELVRQKLMKELKEWFPDPSQALDYLTLEKLPYLVR